MKKTKQEKENQELERIDGKEWEDDGLDYEAVSYTHLTLPTKA